MRWFTVWMLACGWVVPLWADRAAEIARIHVEAIGGRERIEALTSMRMTGTVVANGTRLNVTIVAARPARLRAETLFGARTVIQASDGENPPWQLDSATAKPAQMSASATERFLADAEFDDLLVRWEERGFRVEYAGETEVGGRRLLRVLVARKVSENIFLLLDPQTYFIVLRQQTLTRGAEPIELVTRYDDYRPVNGVLVPHGVTLFENGRQTQQAKFDRIEANPQVEAAMFSLPR